MRIHSHVNVYALIFLKSEKQNYIKPAMFGKLSLHFANANLPPNPLGSQGSLAIRELLQKPATQAIQGTAEDSITRPNISFWGPSEFAPLEWPQTPNDCRDNPNFDPRNFHRWSDEEKAQMAYEYRNYHHQSYILRPMISDFMHMLKTAEQTDIMQYIQVNKNNAHQVLVYIRQCWASSVIEAYMQETNGEAKDNLISWIDSKNFNYRPYTTKGIQPTQYLIYINTVFSGLIPYVIRYNIKPKLNLTIDLYADQLAVIKEIYDSPDLLEFIQLTDPGSERPVSDEIYIIDRLKNATVQTLSEDKDQSQIAQVLGLIHLGRAFGEFEKRYASGIPHELYAQWSYYGALSVPFVQQTLDTWATPKYNRRIAIIAFKRTPFLDDIYHHIHQ
jgi:hypothetical protein